MTMVNSGLKGLSHTQLCCKLDRRLFEMPFVYYATYISNIDVVLRHLNFLYDDTPHQLLM